MGEAASLSGAHPRSLQPMRTSCCSNKPSTALQKQSGLGGQTWTRPTGNHPTRAEWTRWASVHMTHQTPPYKSRVDSVGQRGLCRRQPSRIARPDSVGQRGQNQHATSLQGQSGVGGPTWTRPTGHHHSGAERTRWVNMKETSRKYQQPAHRISNTYQEKTTYLGNIYRISNTSRPGGRPLPHKSDSR